MTTSKENKRNIALTPPTEIKRMRRQTDQWMENKQRSYISGE